MRAAIEIVCWLLPASRLKNVLLRRFGHRISDTARIGSTIVLRVRRFEIGDYVQISAVNAFKNLGLVRLDSHAAIASWNWFTAVPGARQIDSKAGTLIMEHGASITSRHYLDATGTIIMKPFARIGGGRAYIQTHEPDFDNFRIAVGRIVIGQHSFVNSCAVMLSGSKLPNHSVLDANSTMFARPTDDERPGLYAGTPAQWRREIDGKFFKSTEYRAEEFVIDCPMGSLYDGSEGTSSPNGGDR
jgi:acetyltransferase-like isoleucine patch superfamily enzyme